mgnify:CR=1 FL=1|tara:strand:- start:19043 stop:19888 length:846 start_codon:yes stop_codon:yes gene_type:complete
MSHEEKQGWLINAGNNTQSYYQAAAVAMLIKIHSKLSVAVIIDKTENWPSEYNDCIDYIVEYPFGDLDYSKQCPQINQYQFYHITPFAENIVIEADTLVLSDVDYIVSLLDSNHVNILFPIQVTDFRAKPYIPLHVLNFPENKIEIAHAGIWLFNANKESLDYFKMLDIVCHNWRELFKEYFRPEHVPEYPELDAMHSVTLKMLDEYESSTVNDPLLLSYSHLISKPDQKWNDQMNTWYTNNFKVDNYRQNGIVKYTEPSVITGTILNGIRAHHRSANRTS